jgi:TolB-like protein
MPSGFTNSEDPTSTFSNGLTGQIISRLTKFADIAVAVPLPNTRARKRERSVFTLQGSIQAEGESCGYRCDWFVRPMAP